MSSIKEECLFGKLDFQGNNRRLLLNKPELLRAINNAVESNSLPSLREQIYQLRCHRQKYVIGEIFHN